MSEIQPRIPNTHYPDNPTPSEPIPVQELVITEKADLVSIADAIREKAGLEDGFAFPQGFIDAISGIESGGNLIMGTITLNETSSTTTINLDDYGYVHTDGVWPRARFLFESDMFAYNDTTHTKKRMMGRFDFIPLETNNADNNIYVYIVVTQASGSGALNSSTNGAAKFWYMKASDIKGSAVSNYFGGRISNDTRELYIAPTTSSNGLIVGRTYVWGVII